MVKENLHIFTRTFGKAIKFNLADGSIIDTGVDGLPLKGIFDNAYFLQEIGDVDIDNTQPRLTCVMEDIAKVKKEDTVEIDGDLYDVTKDPQPDGTGMGIVILSKYGKM